MIKFLKRPSKKKILYIDMDGVLADFGKAIKDISPGLETSDDYPNYNERRDKVHDVCAQNPRIFLHLEPIPGSIEAVDQLFPLFEIYFLSTPMWVVPESYTDKMLWLQKYFGEKAAERLILTHRKDLAIGDILVDDRLRNGVDKFKGVHIHFAANEYFADWGATLYYLLKLAEKGNNNEKLYYLFEKLGKKLKL